VRCLLPFLAGVLLGAIAERRWIMHMRDELNARWWAARRSLNGRNNDQDHGRGR
jgi:hypothetical protein